MPETTSEGALHGVVFNEILLKGGEVVWGRMLKSGEWGMRNYIGESAWKLVVLPYTLFGLYFV